MKPCKRPLGSLEEEWRAVDVLVNNAGLALDLSTIDEGNTDDWGHDAGHQCKRAPLCFPRSGPLDAEPHEGHIVNIGSTAAKTVYAKGNVYCASKAAVDALSQGMRIDLLPYNIKVTAVHPGAARNRILTGPF